MMVNDTALFAKTVPFAGLTLCTDIEAANTETGESAKRIDNARIILFIAQ